MENTTQKYSKSTHCFYHCEKCDYTSANNSNFQKHLKSLKHNTTKILQQKYSCICGKDYKHRSSLYNHKKICKVVIEQANSKLCNLCDFSMNQVQTRQVSQTSQEQILLGIVQQNKELQQLLKEQQDAFQDQMKLQEYNHHKQLLELIPKVGNTTNKFNMNIFLHTQCKDALNLMEFIKTLPIQMNDLEQTGTKGFVSGISNIFIRGLRDLELTKRPIHCSDLKREILYIKEDDTWYKEAEEKERLHRAIQYIKRSNLQMIAKWVEDNPDCVEDETKNKTYMNIVRESVGGCEGETDKNIHKIMREISKYVTIDKDTVTAGLQDISQNIVVA